MLEQFADLPEAVTNTQTLAERCEVKLEFGRLRLPQPDLPAGKSALEHLQEIAYAGLDQRYTNPPAGHRDRLAYELQVIEETGFAEYFLIVMDFAQFRARSGDRESGAGLGGGKSGALLPGDHGISIRWRTTWCSSGS